MWATGRSAQQDAIRQLQSIIADFCAVCGHQLELGGALPGSLRQPLKVYRSVRKCDKLHTQQGSGKRSRSASTARARWHVLAPLSAGADSSRWSLESITDNIIPASAVANLNDALHFGITGVVLCSAARGR